MKKKYIILTNFIDGVGGAQIYVKNKVKFFKELGWDVNVLYYGSGTIILTDLRCFENNGIPLLRCYPQGLSDRKINSIVDEIISNTDKNEYKEIIIESHEISLALWGELAAKQLEAKHFIFLLQETFPTLPQDIYDYLDFKHKRKELVGISSKSLEMLFHGYKEISESERYSLRAVCSNIVEDVSNKIIDSIVKEDINIGSITRLEKPYVIPMINEIICFADYNKDKTIQLVIVGSSVSGEIEKLIYNRAKNIPNLKVLITGYMYPVPRSLFKIIDIFIGVSGSAQATAAEGALTLTLDVRDSKPIGLLGYDTNNNIFRDSQNTESISTVLQRVLIEQPVTTKHNGVKKYDFREVFQTHLEFIYSGADNKAYYEVRRMRISLYDMAKKITLRILGVKYYQRLVNLRTKLKIERWNCEG